MAATNRAPYHPIETKQILEAMRLVEEAQTRLYRACDALSSVRGCAAQWRKAATLGDKCKKLWEELEVKAAERGT